MKYLKKFNESYSNYEELKELVENLFIELEDEFSYEVLPDDEVDQDGIYYNISDWSIYQSDYLLINIYAIGDLYIDIFFKSKLSLERIIDRIRSIGYRVDYDKEEYSYSYSNELEMEIIIEL